MGKLVGRFAESQFDQIIQRTFDIVLLEIADERTGNVAVELREFLFFHPPAYRADFHAGFVGDFLVLRQFLETECFPVPEKH